MSMYLLGECDNLSIEVLNGCRMSTNNPRVLVEDGDATTRRSDTQTTGQHLITNGVTASNSRPIRVICSAIIYLLFI